MISAKRVFLGVVLGCLLICCTAPAFAADGEVIGHTAVLHLTPSPVLIAADPAEAAGVQAFNYFFCLEVAVALVAVWAKMFISVFKSEVVYR